MAVPYIGITGFMTSQEVQTVLQAIPQKSERKLMVGVLVSQKTMRGEKNKWPNRYPVPENVSGIFVDHPSAFNVIHYNTKEPAILGEQLARLTELCRPRLHGFQLNLAWPDSHVLARFRFWYPNSKVKIILQMGSKALEKVGPPEADYLPERLARWVDEDYVRAGLIDYVLLDPSGGWGKPLDTEKMRAYLRALKAKCPELGLGVAGGLGPTKLGLVGPLVPEFPNLSMDVESGVRDTDDRLDLNFAVEYVSRAFTMFDSSFDHVGDL